MSYLIKVILYFFASTLVAVGFGLGASFGTGYLIPGLVVALLVAASAVAGGVALTVAARSVFKLAQTGRFVQYASFWAAGALALKVASALFGTVLVVSNAPLTAFVALVVCFTAATLSGQIPWKGRTWLPVRLQSKK